MSDETVTTENETLDTPSSVEETEVEVETKEVETQPEKEEEPRVPLSRLKEETSKRRELESRLADMELRLNSIASNRTPSNEQVDPEVEAALEKLTPLLEKKGFVTRQQKEEEDQAKAYAEEMRNLSKELDGSDGRPAFDPQEVTEWAKSHRVYDLKSAYELMYKKELFDWELKRQNKQTSVKTETPSGSAVKKGTEPMLTRELIAKKMAGPGGLEWWEKNREKILAAQAKGEIS